MVDEFRCQAELVEGLPQCRVPVLHRRIEAVVCGHLARRFPHALGRVELGAVGRQTVQFDLILVFAKPLFACFIEPVTGTVVDDHEDLARSVMLYDLEQELVERVAVEHVGELVNEGGVVHRYCPEHMRGLAQSVGGDTGLDADR